MCQSEVVGQFATDHTGRPADHRAPRRWSTRGNHQKEPRFARVWGFFLVVSAGRRVAHGHASAGRHTDFGYVSSVLSVLIRSSQYPRRQGLDSGARQVHSGARYVTRTGGQYWTHRRTKHEPDRALPHTKPRGFRISHPGKRFHHSREQALSGLRTPICSLQSAIFNL